MVLNMQDYNNGLASYKFTIKANSLMDKVSDFRDAQEEQFKSDVIDIFLECEI